jgi:hypothetical protein
VGWGVGGMWVGGTGIACMGSSLVG